MTREEEERIAAIAASDAPLVVCDVDDVVFAFVHPFMRFLDSHGHELRLQSFALTGNVFVKEAAEPVEGDVVKDFLERFFGEHDTWQTAPEAGALEGLGQLRDRYGADIVFLTAMPPKHHARRRALLDLHGLSHPMIATEVRKGDALRPLLEANPERPVAFIDDLPHNHASVLARIPHALTVHLMATKEMRRHLPDLPEGVVAAEDWPQAVREISAFFERETAAG